MRGELFTPILTTDELLDATGDRAWLQAMLDAEAALARAQADVGLIPAADADAIVAACDASRFDVAAIGRAARGGGNPVIPLVDALRAVAPASAHSGATSQDILDTAAMLVASRSLGIVDREVAAVAAGCAALADRYRDTPMIGRTLLQHALPITFGLKAAGWLDGMLDARALLGRVRLAAQLGGPVGTLASMGDDGPAVAARFAVHVGLPEPKVPWHTARQRVAELGSALAIVAGTAAKIAGDVALMMQTEVGEAFEPAAPGRGGSSSMAHKRNPVLTAEIDAAARRATALVPVLLGALVADHERSAGAWHAEWDALADLLALAGGAAANVRVVVEGLEVDTERMAANLGAAPIELGAASAWIDRVLARHREET